MILALLYLFLAVIVIIFIPFLRFTSSTKVPVSSFNIDLLLIEITVFESACPITLMEF